MPWEPLRGPRDDQPAPFGDGLDRLLRNLGGPSAASVGGLFEDWVAIVGEGVAAHAQPGVLRQGALVVLVDDPAWASQLKYLRTDLLYKLHAAGHAEITSLELRVRGEERGGGRRRS
ncbi:MAG: DUF721 domain-containing protein [Acidimicrobiales bacterium]|jgi:predicted nucleic acid-binding Zn ribbon protein|nr:DUF721 domain-containing protein [Acidimicrobiales bacterium]